MAKKLAGSKADHRGTVGHTKILGRTAATAIALALLLPAGLPIRPTADSPKTPLTVEDLAALSSNETEVPGQSSSETPVDLGDS